MGFISGRSTTLQLLIVMDEWTEILDNGGRIDSIYMDFMKAFDKVPHRRLIKKMEWYGIGKRVLNWVKDFLKNRKQNVSVNGAESACQDVTRGIPQGSVPEYVDAVAYLFADDTKLYKKIKREEDSEKLQKDLDSLQKWSDTWLLKFHSNKCKVMTVSSKKKREEISNQYHLYDNLGQEIELQTSEGEKDIGDLVD